MSRLVLFSWLLLAGWLLVSRVGVADDSTPLAPVDEDVAADADGLTALTVQIVSGARTTFEDAPWVGLSCRLSNRSKAPLMFVGYRSESFDPPLAKGQISPIYMVELQRDGKWEKHPIGWCGTGMDGIELAAKESNTFGLSVPVDPPWTAVRVGVSWSRPLDFRTAEADAFRIAWSEPLALVEIDEKPAKPSKTGAITHGKWHIAYATSHRLSDGAAPSVGSMRAGCRAVAAARHRTADLRMLLDDPLVEHRQGVQAVP